MFTEVVQAAIAMRSDVTAVAMMVTAVITILYV